MLARCFTNLFSQSVIDFVVVTSFDAFLPRFQTFNPRTLRIHMQLMCRPIVWDHRRQKSADR